MSARDIDDAVSHPLAATSSPQHKPAPAFSFMKATSSSLQKQQSPVSLPVKSHVEPDKPFCANAGSRHTLAGVRAPKVASCDLICSQLSPSPQSRATVPSKRVSHASDFCAPSTLLVFPPLTSPKGHMKPSPALFDVRLSAMTLPKSCGRRSPPISKAGGPGALPESNSGFLQSLSPSHSTPTFGNSSLRSHTQPKQSPLAPQTWPEPIPKPSHNVFERLYPHKPSANPAPTPAGVAKDEHKPVAPKPRISCIEDLISILCAKDPTFLSNPNQGHDISESAPVPYSALNRHTFNEYELRELARKPHIYYLPDPGPRSLNPAAAVANFGYDHLDGNYVVHMNDHIAYRYELVRVLGKGTFGNVVMARDHKYRHSLVAIKIVKNEPAYSLQAMSEVKFLKLLAQQPHPHMLQLYAHFVFRGHVCLVTEALGINLYRMMELTDFAGMSPHTARPFMYQILAGVDFIHDHGIIHCDIKPENIMLSRTQANGILVKIIDMGLACFNGLGPNTYIQSRFYRAPEVLWGAPYDAKIDVWLVACVMVELVAGYPLLPGRSEAHQCALMLELLGAPEPAIITRMQRSMILGESAGYRGTDTNPPRSKRALKLCLLFKLFDGQGKLLISTLSQLAQADRASTRPVRLGWKLLDATLGIGPDDDMTNRAMLALLRRMLTWDPRTRPNVLDMLNEPFFTDPAYET